VKSTLSLPLLVALTGSAALAEDLPPLGRSATADVVAALTDVE
jgi:hypothetical protein